MKVGPMEAGTNGCSRVDHAFVHCISEAMATCFVFIVA